MNNLLIIGLSVLIGMATAGTVWYCWGLSDNLLTVGKNRKLKRQASSSPDEDEDEESKA